MKKIVLVSLAFLVATAQADDVRLSGFGLATFQAGRADRHVRLIVEGSASKHLDLRLTLTPDGPNVLPLITYGEIIWKQPCRGVETITFGRTLPPFGREWWEYRVDQVPAVFFSDINAPLAVIDTGVTVTGRAGRLHWYGGWYAGDRVLGNVPSGQGGGDVYLRGDYALNQSWAIGASQRVGPVPANGFDLMWRQGRSRVMAETIASKGVSQHEIVAEHRVGRTTPFIRWEHLTDGHHWSGGVRYRFFHSADLKLITAGDRISGQLAVRF